MCSNFSKHQGALEFFFKCNYHPLERLCFIPCAAKFLKPGKRTCDCSRNKSMLYLGWKGPTGSAVNGPGGAPSCALGGSGPWSEPISGQELGFEPHLLPFHSHIHKPKATWEAQEWDLQLLTGSGSWLHFWTLKNSICCTPGHPEICPAKPFIHTQVSTGRKPRNAANVELEGSPKDSARDQVPGKGKCSLTWSVWSFPEGSRTPLWHNVQM